MINSKITKLIIITVLFSSVGFTIWQYSIPKSPVREIAEGLIWKSKYWIGKVQMYIKHTDNIGFSKQISTQKFYCDGRQHCSQMRSCEEARYFLQNCPNTKMDGDRDGKPCENWCGH